MPISEGVALTILQMLLKVRVTHPKAVGLVSGVHHFQRQ